MSSTPRVYAAELRGAVDGALITLGAEESHHLGRVLRVGAGQTVILFDGAGYEARARLEAGAARARASALCARVNETPRAGIGPDSAGAILLQGYPKGDKLDAVVRQSTELGVLAIWPVYTTRSVPRPRGEGAARSERLRAIARSASAQCGRADVPEVRDATALEQALAALDPAVGTRLVAWEQGGIALRSALAEAAPDAPCAVFVGPEGGLDVRDLALARAAGFVAVTLGPRVLRTETVAPALLGALSFARGDLGRRG